MSKFERQNDVLVNVYILKKFNGRYEVSPLHLTSFKQTNHIRLLLIQDYYVDEYDEGYNDDGDLSTLPTFHYVLIKNLSRLVKRQLSSEHTRCFICYRCLHFFWTQEKLDTHEIELAITKDSVSHIMSNTVSMIHYQNTRVIANSMKLCKHYQYGSWKD